MRFPWCRPEPQVSIEVAPAADPYAGIVNGPLLVVRTLRNRALHEAALRDDDGFPIQDWGPFVNPYDETPREAQ